MTNAKNNTLEEINRRNTQFWEAQKVLVERRLADEAILATALEIIESEARRLVPVYFQKSFEEALWDAERAKQRFRRQQGQEGRRARKNDALQDLTLGVVQQNPAISAKQLLRELRKDEHRRIIQEVGDETIRFVNYDGINNTIGISGLKDRLSRAKKKIKSR
jgi:hypothetical protein